MPQPRKDEKQNDYISRCLKEVLGEGKTKEQALGQCYGMWRQAHKTNDAMNVAGFESPEPGNLGEEGKRLLAKVYAQCRKGQTSPDKKKCAKIAWAAVEKAGFKHSVKDEAVFENIEKILDGECDCQNINDETCIETIIDKFNETDAAEVKTDFKLNYPLDDILEGLNIELEHKDITGGDLEETAKIVIAHLKERPDYYKKLKEYVETKDSQIIYDIVSIHNKKATIMRDGYYKYLAKEVDRNAVYPMDIVNVYRPPEEVKKAFIKFKDELKKLPVIANHPEQDLDLKNPESFRDGEGIKPELKIVNGETLLDCELSNMQGKVKEFYDKGIKEISCGWHGEYEKVEGKDYQYIQRFKDFNHIAILEQGRCGNTCSIKDNEIQNKEVLDMTKEELEQLVDQKVNDKVAEILDNKQKEHEANETKKKEAEEEKKKSEGKKEEPNEPKDDEIEDAYLNGDEDEDDLEKAKGKLKKFKDCFAKMKAKKVEVKDEDVIAMYDKKIEDTKILIRDAFIENSKGTYEAVEMGILNSKEVIGKTPCEIKAMVIKKVLDEEISINDMSTVNTLFDIALKNYENPIWKQQKNINDKGLVGIEAMREKSRIELEKIARGEKLGGN
jgi:hypothetical protein